MLIARNYRTVGWNIEDTPNHSSKNWNIGDTPNRSLISCIARET